MTRGYNRDLTDRISTNICNKHIRKNMQITDKTLTLERYITGRTFRLRIALQRSWGYNFKIIGGRQIILSYGTEKFMAIGRYTSDLSIYNIGVYIRPPKPRVGE